MHRTILPVMALLSSLSCSRIGQQDAALGPGNYEPSKSNSDLELPAGRGDALRQAALRRARVWRMPDTAIAEARLDQTSDPDVFPEQEPIDCKFLLKSADGYTPKFNCILRGGEVIRIKYGARNPEVRSEVAATRLMRALGFEADRMYPVAKVRCFGCPPYPYPRLSWLDRFFSRQDEDSYVEFTNVAIERRAPGKKINAQPDQGWRWDELEQIDPEVGSSAAELDAFRLMAVFLASWDGKSDNHILLCEPGAEMPPNGEACRSTVAYVHDLGSTFGPRVLNLEGWRTTPIWSDPSTCRVSMKAMPHSGATFVDREISESGRKLLADLLTQLSDEQIETLFAAAGLAQYNRLTKEQRQPVTWKDVFKDRVRQIVERTGCKNPDPGRKSDATQKPGGVVRP